MILFLASNDYSNLSHNWANSLRSIGADCVDLVLEKHALYPRQSQRATIGRMMEYCREAEVVVVMHSSDQIYEHIKFCGKRIIVSHTGTRYRENHAALEKKFAGLKSITDQCEFMVLGNHRYITAPIELKPARFYQSGLLKVGHYPSNAFVKGTEKIIEMVEPFRNRMNWQYSETLVDHERQLKRIADCDVYIELFKPELRGKPYGCFGVTALEAAALGKIVITNNLYPQVYTEAYGKSPFTVANTEQEFTNCLNGILRMKPTMFKKLQRETAEITRENHSFEATGHKLISLIYE